MERRPQGRSPLGAAYAAGGVASPDREGMRRTVVRRRSRAQAHRFTPRYCRKGVRPAPSIAGAIGSDGGSMGFVFVLF
jgi:hypothetical protein